MKKLYSIVLMAAALLVGTNAWAESVATWDALRAALEDGGEVTLSDNINVVYDATTFKSVLIGAKNAAGTTLAVDGDAPAAATLNLAGHNITITSNSFADINPFVLTKGSLKVTGTGKIKIEGKLNKSTNVFFVFGADDANKVDPKGANPFTHLEIDANVAVETNNGTVIAVDQLTASHAALKKTDFAGKGYATSGMAYGVRIDVLGALTSQNPQTGANEKKCYGIKVNGNVKKPADEANYKYAPYVHIYPSAVVVSDMSAGLAGSAAAYASGYGQWLIEGNCSGATGVYISSGVVAIKDATVKSGADAYASPGASGHANGSGSAIVINSRSNYQGQVEITISGDSKVEATSGYAFEDIVNTKDANSKVDSIKIEGGTFEGGSQGALVITPTTASEAQVVVNGGNVEGAANVGTEGLAEFLNNQGGTHTTLVEEGGKTILVISEGTAPTGYANVAGHAGESVKWTGAAETLSDNLTLTELEINEATAQALTIADGVTLEVGRVVLGANAQIIVNAGAKFIVTGEQGIVAPVATNIVLKNEEGKRSIFLFNPAVTSNKHPNATVELTTKSWWKDAEHYQWENFGIPTHNTLKSITCEKVGGNVVYEEIQTLSNGSWVSLGYIGGTYSIDVTKLSKPFAAYNIIAYRDKTEDAPKCIMTGELVGNTNNALDANMKWSAFGNSYTAEIDAVALIAGLNNVDKGVYVSEYQGNGELAWNTYAAEDAADDNLKIAPMQSFLLLNKGAYSVEETINYANMVYAPATAAPAPAPRRSANNNTTKFRVIIANEQGVSDNVKLRESATATTLEKYMNDDVNIYAMADEKNAVFASEDLENTYLGVSTVKGGMFTISFAKVEGRELTLIDHETGARVAIAEDNTYEFTAAANSVNDYRFEIVESAKLPTAIENTEAVKSAKGVYTITGQYVGEMNVWNTLPAGIYVVNGEKRVK